MLLREVSWREQMWTKKDFAHRTALPSVETVSDRPINQKSPWNQHTGTSIRFGVDLKPLAGCMRSMGTARERSIEVGAD